MERIGNILIDYIEKEFEQTMRERYTYGPGLNPTIQKACEQTIFEAAYEAINGHREGDDIQAMARLLAREAFRVAVEHLRPELIIQPPKANEGPSPIKGLLREALGANND